MKTFKFYQDVKCTVWVRQSFNIEAESLDDAKRKAIKFRDVDVSGFDEFQDREFNYDTEELVLLEENDFQDTIQLFAGKSDTPFATNGNDDLKQMNCNFDEYKDAHQVAFRELAGYTVECAYNDSTGYYHAFHKHDKLNVIVLLAEKRAVQYTFPQSWDDLVNTNQKFKSHMALYLKKKYKKNPNINNEIFDWWTGHLTEMVATSDAVDDSVPFDLADLIDGAAQFASKRELMPVKLIGYQVVGDNDELPDGLFSFHIIQDREQAIEILRRVQKDEPHKKGMCIYPVYEEEIEKPSFI